MRPDPDPPGPGQESVWAYPRPPRAELTPAHVMIVNGGLVVADTRAAVRTLETSHPPSYYIPPSDIAPGCLRRAAGSSFCEWKGHAVYWDVVIGDRVLPRVGWSYPDPTAPFAILRSRRLLRRPLRPLQRRRRDGRAPGRRLLRRLDHLAARRPLQGRPRQSGVVRP